MSPNNYLDTSLTFKIKLGISSIISLYNKGLRVLTLNWRGQSCIGGGWDTDSPLTDFGREIVKECARLGIIIDLSHSSEKVQDEVFQMSVELGIAPIYSHSNSYTVCTHKRNISDEHFTMAVRCNGLVGINLCPKFLENDGSADIYSVLNHIDHFLFLGGESTLALGCDFDGTSSLPAGISDISDLPRLYEIIAKKYGDRFANDIFFYNAFNFWSKNSK